MTEARCVVGYFHGQSTDQRLDDFKHLVNICTVKARGRNAYWSQRPHLKFVRGGRMDIGGRWVGGRLAEDPENYDPYDPILRKINTRYWFMTHLSEHISKYSSEHITRRELLELARMKDQGLLRVCHALVCDMINEGLKAELHELAPDPGTPPVEVAAPTSEKPDYDGAVKLLVGNPELRHALPKHVSKTLETLFRKLDAGVGAGEVIGQIAHDRKKHERTIRRHLRQAHLIATGVAAPSLLLKLVADFVLPTDHKDHASPLPTHPRADRAEYQIPITLVLGGGSTN